MAFRKKKLSRGHKHDDDDKHCSQDPLKYVAEEKVEKTNAGFSINYSRETIRKTFPLSKMEQLKYRY